MMILAFSFMLKVVGGEVDDGDYSGLHPLLAMIIQVGRNSIGDLAVLESGKWGIDYENNETPNFA